MFSKRITSLLIICAIVAQCLACTVFADSTHSFKQSNWGDSIDDVKAVEGTPIDTGVVDANGADYLLYNASVAGKNAYLAYYFGKDGLFAARYILNETYSDMSKYIEDYEAVRKALTKKYGNPSYDDEIWTDTTKKSTYSDDKPTALELGYISYYTTFEIKETTVQMSMDCDNAEVTTMIQFESTSVMPDDIDFSKTFHHFSWGASKETVIEEMGKARFTGEMTDLDAEYIGYETRFIELDSYVVYYFCDRGLCEIRYGINEEHSNNDKYIDDYEQVRDILISMYGIPLYDGENWSELTKKVTYFNRKGDAVIDGYLTYSTGYEFDDTEVFMYMRGEDNAIVTTISFNSISITANERDYSADF